MLEARDPLVSRAVVRAGLGESLLLRPLRTDQHAVRRYLTS